MRHGCCQSVVGGAGSQMILLKAHAACWAGPPGVALAGMAASTSLDPSVLASIMASPGAPEAAPLCAPSELLNWQPHGPLSRLCRAAVSLLPCEPGQQDGLRLLACHDMTARLLLNAMQAGGYGEDRLVQGGSDADFYRLTRWSCLDTFVYFSHKLVAIPPPGWINAAHRHGVRVLGTLITEWEPGAAACRELFGSAEAAEAAAGQLAAIAAFHGFEGWLVNIENEMEAEHIPHLLHFLRVLTGLMREVAPGWSEVIWYDAVTTEGKLEWQNALTPLNRPFFDACDALWVNYTWKEGTPAAVRAEAGDRAADVYMGVDCFGRGTYGGGGFGCGAALTACLDQGLSAALFATGWPFEGDCGPDAPACWRQRDGLFWAGIEAAWSAGHASSSSRGVDSGSAGGGTKDGPATGVEFQIEALSLAANAPPDSGSRQQQQQRGGRRTGAHLGLPLCSNFSPGSGPAFFLGGRQVSPRPWYNLSLQAPLPLLAAAALAAPAGSSSAAASGQPAASGGVDAAAGSSSSGDGVAGSEQENSATRSQSPCSVQAAVSEALAYSGGSSLRVSGALLPGQRACVRLFEPGCRLPAGSGCWVRLVAFLQAGSVSAGLRLHLQSSLGCPGGPNSRGQGQGDGSALSLDWLPGLSGSSPDSWQQFESCFPPDVLALDGGAAPVLTAVDLVLEGGPGASSSEAGSAFELYIGEVGIETGELSSPPAPPSSVHGLTACDVQLSPAGREEDGASGSNQLSARLEWQPPAEGARCSHVWCAFGGAGGADDGAVGEPGWLGAACADGFVVCGLAVPPGASSATFAVQAEGRNGLPQALAAAARVTVGLAAEQQ